MKRDISSWPGLSFQSVRRFVEKAVSARKKAPTEKVTENGDRRFQQDNICILITMHMKRFM